MIVSSLVAVYYNMILAWSLFYVFATLINASELPWANCDSSWNTYRTLNCYIFSFQSQLQTWDLTPAPMVTENIGGGSVSGNTMCLKK